MDYQQRVAWAVIGVAVAGGLAMWLILGNSSLVGTSPAKVGDDARETSSGQEMVRDLPKILSEEEKRARAIHGLERAERSYRERAARLKGHYATAMDLSEAREDELRAATAKFTLATSADHNERELSERGARLQDQIKGQMRELFASATEESLIKNGMDASVSVVGKERGTLQMTYSLMSRPHVYKLTNESTLRQDARSLGFKRIVFTNGLSGGLSESWAVDL